MKSKVCRLCRKDKPLAEFHSKRAECKICRPHHNRQSTYGISQETYGEMLEAQRYRCAICKNPMTDPKVDHCHHSGDVRGLLCHNCNTGLGLFKDDVRRFASAINYLQQHNARPL